MATIPETAFQKILNINKQELTSKLRNRDEWMKMKSSS